MDLTDEQWELLQPRLLKFLVARCQGPPAPTAATVEKSDCCCERGVRLLAPHKQPPLSQHTKRPRVAAVLSALENREPCLPFSTSVTWSSTGDVTLRITRAYYTWVVLKSSFAFFEMNPSKGTAQRGDPLLHAFATIDHQQATRYELSGEFKADESYLEGSTRVSPAAGGVADFGLLTRGGKVYTALIHNVKTECCCRSSRRKVRPDLLVNTDTFGTDNSLDVSRFRHLYINYSTLFTNKRNHINGIENYWNQAKRHLRRFNNIKKENLYWFLKKCEWGFNGGSHK